TRRTECLGGEKAFGDSNTQQHEPRGSSMPGLRMLIMPFNLATAVAATIALTYCCCVVLLFVWRALDTGFLPHCHTGIACAPGKYWSRLAWLSILGFLCGAAAICCGLWIVPFCWTHLSS